MEKALALVLNKVLLTASEAIDGTVKIWFAVSPRSVWIAYDN